MDNGELADATHALPSELTPFPRMVLLGCVRSMNKCDLNVQAGYQGGSEYCYFKNPALISYFCFAFSLTENIHP